MTRAIRVARSWRLTAAKTWRNSAPSQSATKSEPANACSAIVQLNGNGAPSPGPASAPTGSPGSAPRAMPSSAPASTAAASK